MADMTSIINEIKGLEQYTKAMRTVYEQKGLREDLDNLLMHINNLKAWAGIDVEAGENTLPIQNISFSLPFMDLEQAEKEAMETDYACFAVGEDINTGDAGAFYLEGYSKARMLLGNES